MDTRATITIERTSGQITGRVAEGFVLVRDDGTLADQIQDCDADLGDVYDEIELAISGEDLPSVVAGGELTGEVEADGVTYRWTVRRPPLTDEADAEPTGVHCECGAWSSESCLWTGRRSDTVLVDYAPPEGEAARTAAEYLGTPGSQPGTLRLRVERSCADRMLRDCPEAVRVVEE